MSPPLSDADPAGAGLRITLREKGVSLPLPDADPAGALYVFLFSFSLASSILHLQNDGCACMLNRSGMKPVVYTANKLKI